MISLFLCITYILTVIFSNQTIIAGSTYGLMLWYQKLVPLLLPSIIVSNYILDTCYTNTIANKPQKAKFIAINILLGLTCGYPIGCKISCDLFKNQILNKKETNILLATANFVSPMFLCGYIKNYILGKNISLILVFIYIYIPIIATLPVYILIQKYIFSKSAENTKYYNLSSPGNSYAKSTDISMQCITLITKIGLIVILCSILTQYIIESNINENIKNVSVGLIEITRGTDYIINCELLSIKKKIALILSVVSFGGISSILQMKQLTKQLKLSLKPYIIYKLIVSIITYIEVILLI